MTGCSHILSRINRLRGPKEGHEFPQTFLLFRCVLRGKMSKNHIKAVKEKQILIQSNVQSSALLAKTILSVAERRTYFTSTEL
jgi:hypothetical protein